jgi:hypothetical protein
MILPPGLVISSLAPITAMLSGERRVRNTVTFRC